MYLVCSVLILLLPQKHCRTTDVAKVASLFPRSASNFTIYYIKTNIFDEFCKQVWQLASSVIEFYSDVDNKVSFFQKCCISTSFELV